jgi:hypothetical protein
MPKRSSRVTSMKPEDMKAKLLDWNPHWTSQSFEGFSFSQLTAVYLKIQHEVLLEVKQTYN